MCVCVHVCVCVCFTNQTKRSQFHKIQNACKECLCFVSLSVCVCICFIYKCMFCIYITSCCVQENFNPRYSFATFYLHLFVLLCYFSMHVYGSLCAFSFVFYAFACKISITSDMTRTIFFVLQTQIHTHTHTPKSRKCATYITCTRTSIAKK